MFDLRHAVQRIVIGLADNRAIDTERIANAANFGDAPCTMVRDAKIANLAGAYEITHGMNSLFQRRLVIFLMEIIDIDEISPKPP